MKHKKQEEESGSSERWLLTYADLITLLLGLFVILYAMSKIDAGKYSQIVYAFGDIFGNTQTGGAGLVPSGLDAPVPIPIRQQLENEIRRALKSSLALGEVSVSQNERGVTVHMMEELLFPSGSAELKSSAQATLNSLAEVLRRVPNDIRIEGHTDDVPIQTSQFASNWHLSVARAVNTGHYLVVRHGLNPEKVAVVGYSEYHPLVPNTSVANRAQNRRVDIVIVTTLAVTGDHQTASTSP